jgi:hypothetical protein
MFPSPTIGGKEFRDKTRDKKIQRFKISVSHLPVMAFGTPPAMGDPPPRPNCAMRWSVAVSSSDTIYFPDLSYGRVRKISGGIITTFAGSGCGFNGDGLWPLFIAFNDPVAVAVDSKSAV